ncbi:hypothetical protein HK102_004872 [Quaeritorhiza haematococci]|nr:hypothetical protein HK102_004872 [Quaeritorhiza haematococci]
MTTILLPVKQARDAERLVDNPSLEVAGWAATGFFIRSFALALQLRPVLERPHIHGVWALGFAGLGYAFSKWENSMLNELERQRDILVKRRMMRLAKEQESSE